MKEKLSTPIQTDDGPIDEQIGEIVWTASSRKDGIRPGEFRDFPLSVVIPGKPGQTLTFKALQTYSNGERRALDRRARRRPARAAGEAHVRDDGGRGPGTRQQANPSVGAARRRARTTAAARTR